MTYMTATELLIQVLLFVVALATILFALQRALYVTDEA